LCKGIAANLYENGEIGRNSVSELVRILLESLLSECRKKQGLQRNYKKNNDINAQNNLEKNNKMQSATKQQLFPVPCSLISTQECGHDQMYEQLEQQKERKKQEYNQNQQFYDIMSKMPDTPTLPPITKQDSKTTSSSL
jgi:hypothetical protein